MAITTNQITIKLHRDFVDKFLPVGEKLRAEGHTDYEVLKVYDDFVKCESIKFYRTQRSPKSIKEAIRKVLANKADSKIEVLYCELLYENLVPFEFQYKIGEFRADFLIDKWLVFEIDGPQHDKYKDAFRDKYMKNMGYEIFRVPAWLASVSHEAVICEIKELVENGIG